MSLYDPVLMKHARRPYGLGPLEGAVSVATVCDTNRPCGDRICFHVAAASSATALTVRFEGEGCALAIGAASALCEVVDQRTLGEARALVRDFAQALADPANASGDPSAMSRLAGDLSRFAEARAFPARVACVTLASAVLLAALERHTLGGGPDDRRHHDR